MTGPPATAGVYRFTNGAELFMATNHPLMNSRVFGLESLASALGIDLRTLDAVYLNPGNYEGFGALFCGGRIDPAVVARARRRGVARGGRPRVFAARGVRGAAPDRPQS